jgi:gluconolactonase
VTGIMSPPGPPELLPIRPDAIVDLQTAEGTALVAGEWRHRDATVEDIEFVDVGPDLGPSGLANRTYDVVPHAEAADFDDSTWQVLAPDETRRRLGHGRVSFGWYRTGVTIPAHVGELDPTGCTVVFEVVLDDYAEVWIDGGLSVALGDAGGQVVGGFNTPNRVVLTRNAQPGQRFQIAVFGMNGPVSASPRNYIWIRSATLDFYSAPRASSIREAPYRLVSPSPGVEAIVPVGARLEQVATGFEFTEGPVWTPDGALLFSSPNTNVIYRWSPHTESVTVFRAKSGYAGFDIGAFHQPGSNGLTFDPSGRLTICQHGNRRVIRVNPRGDITVLADRYEGRRLNSPNDVVYRSDGTLYFTDPPFGLPAGFADAKKELPFSGVFRVRDGEVTLLTDELSGPNGLAFSPDERYLYVGNWDLERKVVMRYEFLPSGELAGGDVFVDMTKAPGDDAVDGVKVDEAGNVYACGPGGVWLLSPSGRRLGTLQLPESPHNLAFGGDDGRDLYVTALTSVYRIRLSIPGITPRQEHR